MIKLDEKQMYQQQNQILKDHQAQNDNEPYYSKDLPYQQDNHRNGRAFNLFFEQSKKFKFTKILILKIFLVVMIICTVIIIFKQINEQTKICIVSWGSYQQKQPKNFRSILQQSYENWEVFYYRDKQFPISLKDKRLFTLQSSGNKGKDIYQAIVTRCSQGSLVFLLNQNQTLKTENQFHYIVQTFKSQTINAAFIDYEIKNTIFKSPDFLMNILKFITFQNKQLVQSSLTHINKLINHFRLFKSQLYKRILYFDLMNGKQQFYQNQLSFLLPILEINNKPQQIFFFLRCVIQIQEQRILTSRIQSFDILNKNKYTHYQQRIFEHLKSNQKVNALSKNIQNAQIIPKILHSVFVDKISDQEHKIMNKKKQVYSEYEHKIWTNENITRKYFPITFMYLKQIFQNSKKKEYLKLAHQLMIWQILYQNGGVFIDSRYQSSKVIQNIRRYPLSVLIDTNLTYYLLDKVIASEAKNQIVKHIIEIQIHDFRPINPTTLPKILKYITPHQFYQSINFLIPQQIFSQTFKFEQNRRIQGQKDCTYIYINCFKNIQSYGIQHWSNVQIQQQIKKYYLIKKQNQNLQICILSVRSSSFEDFKQNYQSLIKQNYVNWKALFYVKNNKQKQIRQKYVTPQFKSQVNILVGTQNQGRNIYDGFNNQCKRESIGLLLNQKQTLFSKTSLQEFIYHFKDKNVYMAAVPFKLNQEIIYPSNNLDGFRRDIYFKDNEISNKSIVQIVQNMIQTIRILRVELLRRMQVFDLIDQNQKFYVEKASFLFPLLEFRGSYSWPQDSEKKFIMPQKFLIFNNASNPLFQTSQKQTIINKNQLIEIGCKIKYLSLQRIILFAKKRHQNGKPPNNYPYMWEHNCDILQRNISDEQKIPKIIHQIWIGETVPQSKIHFINSIKQILFDYQYQFWNSSTITPENFPFTYKYIQKLYQNQWKSRYPLKAMIADLMKIQIVFHHGGFIFDLNYELFQNLNSFLKYPFIGAIQNLPFGGQTVTSNFGAQKNSVFLGRILQPEVLDSIDLTNGLKANLQAGPSLFARGFYPCDYFYFAKIFAPDKFYPYNKWSQDIRQAQSKCTYLKNQLIPSPQQGKYDRIIQTQKFYILNPCRLYPHSIGVDHYDLGGSWITPKW